MISCLCVTHDRHEFMPWLEHQFFKQHVFEGRFRSNNDTQSELLIFDSSPEPWEPTPDSNITVHHCPAWPDISAKRTAALAAAQFPFVTWFDDDDWQSPSKLLRAERSIGMDADMVAVGARSAEMFSTVTGLCRNYESHHEPIIFNSAVYRKSAAPQTFSEHHITGEDTEWHERFFATRPNFITLGEPLHAWLCHTKNITNRANSMFFEKPCSIPFDDWEKKFLQDLCAGHR